ncbi:MAG: S9 family peptidase [Gemmatimonadetes bacterium]|nr:S9 family peptidase [Gemmatimonadota bacterium]
MTTPRMRRSVARLLAASLLAALTTVAAEAHAQRPHSMRAADYLELEQASDPQISPDGKQVVYTRGFIDKVKDEWTGALWIMNADGTKHRFLVEGSNPVWSPDGTRLAYVAMGENPKGPQLFVRWMDAEGATSQVTRVSEAPAAIRWAPDGKSIGFIMFVRSETPWNVELPPPPPNATWVAPPRVVDQLHYRLDRAGFARGGSRQLFTVPADGGTLHQVTMPPLGVGASYDGIAFGAGNWDWTPDGKTVVFEATTPSQADTMLHAGTIYAQRLAGGTPTRLSPAAGQWLKPVVSPDGKMIAYVGHGPTKMTMRTTSLWVMNLDGSNQREITPTLDRDPAMFGMGALLWAPDGSGLYFSPDDRGSKNVVFAPVSGGATRAITSGAHQVTLGNRSTTGTMIGTVTDVSRPLEVARITLTPKGADVARITDINADFVADKQLGTVEEVWYTSTGATKVQGWIVKPPNYDASKKYPMLLEIHGGPQGMYGTNFDPMWHAFAGAGFVVLYTNPRGSTGYGNAFMTAIDKNYPGPDFDDLMAGVDTVVARGLVDPAQLYVSGCSGGGILTSWIITHTTRFAGAAVRCPITNWTSMAGGSDVPLFSHSFFNRPFWESPNEWLEKSPVFHAGKVKTPTLFMTGVLDLRTPIPQSEELYSALKLRGIPTTMLRFEGEWHGTESRPSNWMRTMLYMQSWFGRFGAKPVS